MANINELLARAAALRDETQLNSISPERAGGIMYDTLLAMNELWLQQGAALVISKIYASVSAMEADTAPVSDLTGLPLRPGQIVVIASSDSDNGSVYRYNGTSSPSWSLVGEIGNLEPVDSLDSDSTSLPLAAHQGKVLDGKISQLGQDCDKYNKANIFLNLESRPSLYLEEDTTNGIVYFTYSGTLYVRAVASKQYTISDLATEIGSTLATSPKGKSNCLQIQNISSLCFNSTTGTMVVKSREQITIKDIPVITQTSGFVIFINPGLINYFGNGDSEIRKAYFAAGAKPVFSNIIVNGASSTITIQFPPQEFRIYDENGNIFVETTSFGGQTFVLQSFKRLVYNYETSVIEIVDLNTKGKFEDLFVVSSEGFSGLLAPYLFTPQVITGATNAEQSISSIRSDKLEDIFFIRSDRGSIYLEEDTSYGYVYFKYSGTLFLRGAFSKAYTLQQLATEIGVSLVTSPKGETGCLAIPNISSLVYDNVASVMRFRVRTERVITDTILITSSSGTITYINQGLLNAYDNKQAASNESALSIVDYYSRKTKEIENLAKNNDASFFFFSDIHAQNVNFQRIVQLANSLGTSKVKAIINGGDTVAQVVGDGLGWYNDIVDISNVDVLTCCGNHDIWSSLWTPASRTDVYNAVIAPVVSKVQGIIQPTGAAANGDCYYYKDYGNIRVIVLCAMVESASNQMFWDSAQATWFENVLADARTNNKYVVCVNHSPFAKADVTLDMETKWTSYYAKTWKNDTEHQIFDSIHTSMDAVNLVSAFISAGGKFICWLTGHLHIDSIQKLSGQVMINIASANNNNHVDGYKANIIDNYIYDCFNYIGFDTANNFIKIFRIGWDMDASLRVRNLLTYDFVNQTLVTEN